MLKENKKLDIDYILKDLDKYKPKRRGWVWREHLENLEMGPFEYKDCTKPLKKSVGLPSSKYFNNIDPQPSPIITTEIASGRFEDDIRRMRMAAHHGADHLMVIRTAGQSHFDGLIEGTPQGIGGVPITRKQVRAQRKALDFIEEEVGRPINYHSYVSGVAGPEVAVMFAEEGVNGAHQDPQYNVLYRNINMVRSFVDACEAKQIMAFANIAQIDGAHNANATAREAWKVMPELMVQHALNSIFSEKIGIDKSNICLSTVPPTAPPAPCLRIDLPYAVALRELFSDYKMRAQMNTKYMESSTREATVTHVLNLLTSVLTRADIQSTITPDEGRNVPWHIYNIEACDTAKQALVGMDGLMDMIELKDVGELRYKARELKERAVLYMEEIFEVGGYFESVEQGFFVDSGNYPERNGDGISRKIKGGVGEGTVYERDKDYLAPVTAHFGYNNVAQYDEKAIDNPSILIDGCTFENPNKIIYIDELDDFDNVENRLKESEEYRGGTKIKPEMEWCADGIVMITMMLPTDKRTAEFAALEFVKKMNLQEVEVISREVMHESEGTRIEVKGRVPFDIDLNDLVIPEEPKVLTDEEIRADIEEKPMKIVSATVGEDEHSVGLREIIDIKHGGIEKYGIECHYLGTSVPVEKLVDAAIELNADAILASTIISHDDIHYKNMKKLHDYCVEKGIRDKVMIACGGTQVTPEIAIEQGIDAGFGRNSKGIHVATFLVEKRREMNNK
ncbi:MULTISPECIES: D-ornithine 4,5-aminomutase subunit OraE [unclassified Clostridioides]|uniref:D-ornithine 4,5-aminomutase subunit OraE n=1 Tax=unclassified Clostridioides TaxID=2635829 RepID=UPI001D115064|nr:cobalamin B12-binding domain-containing protein [Clostridioides sp. ES-S-0049-03]MCC0657882.1 cobalamin B12-binding domain-containing protein [Clostridioides sp. ES-S-0123-01]MCC0677138.1 cobalamin B12-binding domain-containing protein [Clostridioides sp. ES-W-0018-02]MCC0695880.1 cobalamin B12-binding domain-containing protein [Clostridioides sp. ES-S-0048-02]MCC0703706.1 cobalamin B12-binding domain-containing protein [Clostridioides sp. ES-S-0049-02]MCC0712003.1 cobalamin B12-binding dom